MASNWVSACSVWQQPMCLYLLSNLQTFISVMGTEVHQRERESTSVSWWHSGFTPTPWIGSLHVVVGCEWLVHCWYYWRQSSFLFCLILTFERILCWGRNRLFSWQTWSIKNKAVPYNLPSQIQDPCSQNYMFQLQRANCSQLAQHLRGGKNIWIWNGVEKGWECHSIGFRVPRNREGWHWGRSGWIWLV